MAFQVNDGCPSPLLPSAKWVSEELGFGQTVPRAGPSSAPQKLRESEAVPWALDLFELQPLFIIQSY